MLALYQGIHLDNALFFRVMLIFCQWFCVFGILSSDTIGIQIDYLGWCFFFDYRGYIHLRSNFSKSFPNVGSKLIGWYEVTKCFGFSGLECMITWSLCCICESKEGWFYLLVVFWVFEFFEFFEYFVVN